jgi:hypothetical protein
MEAVNSGTLGFRLDGFRVNRKLNLVPKQMRLPVGWEPLSQQEIIAYLPDEAIALVSENAICS